MNASPDWWKDFFSGLVVEFWEAAIPPEVTAAETEFLVRELRLVPRALVLDVPCGHGRHALALARRGHDIQGVDISRELLASARRAAVAAQPNIPGSVSFLESDMRNLPWRDVFDAAFCAGRASVFSATPETRSFSRPSRGRSDQAADFSSTPRRPRSPCFPPFGSSIPSRRTACASKRRIAMTRGAERSKTSIR